MNESTLINLAKGFLGESAVLSLSCEDHWPGLYGDESAADCYVLSYHSENELRLGCDRYIAIPKSGKQPFLLNSVGE